MLSLKKITRHFEEFICCLALVIIAVSVFLQVIARYIFEVGLHWTEEVCAMSMVWAVYMGASLAVRERFHIRIMVGVYALPQTYGKIVVFIADILWLAFSVFMLKISWEYLSVIWKFPETSISLSINQVYPQSILIIGYTLMIIRLIETYVLWFKEGRTGIPGMLVEDLDKEYEA